MKKIFLSLLFVMGISVSVVWAQQKESPGMIVPDTGTDLHYTLIPSADGAWGFAVYDGERLLLYQPVIVLNASEEPLRDKTQAERLAQLATERIRKGGNPEAVDEETLKTIN
ncbi:MAG: DUF4907 domain-containing protein [Bacteroidia bacterium]|nr:DUF4907 domain-containing protein [Bacteroidia bacterium]